MTYNNQDIFLGRGLFGMPRIFVMAFGLILMSIEYLVYLILRPILVITFDGLVAASANLQVAQITGVTSMFTFLAGNVDIAFVVAFLGTLGVFVFYPAVSSPEASGFATLISLGFLFVVFAFMSYVFSLTDTATIAVDSQYAPGTLNSTAYYIMEGFNHYLPAVVVLVAIVYVASIKIARG